MNVKKTEIIIINKPEKIPYVIEDSGKVLWKNSGLNPNINIKEKQRISTIKESEQLIKLEKKINFSKLLSFVFLFMIFKSG